MSRGVRWIIWCIWKEWCKCISVYNRTHEDPLCWTVTIENYEGLDRSPFSYSSKKCWLGSHLLVEFWLVFLLFPGMHLVLMWAFGDFGYMCVKIIVLFYLKTNLPFFFKCYCCSCSFYVGHVANFSRFSQCQFL